METRELQNVQLRVTDCLNNIMENPVRKLNYRFMVAEWLWISLGLDDVKTLAFYNKEMEKFSDDGVQLAGAYGPRIRRQLQHIEQTLMRDRYSRQAVLTIWTPNPGPSKDVPCTVDMHWMVRDDQLHCTVHMRSSDIWLGLPYDFFTFSMLTNMIAGKFGIRPGHLVMNLDSSHLYEQHYELASGATFAQSQNYRSGLLTTWPNTHVQDVLQGKRGDFPQGEYDRYCKAVRMKTSQECFKELIREP